MSVVRWSPPLLVCVVLLTGCLDSQMRAYDRYELGAARGTVVAGVEALGGLDVWRRVGAIRVKAVVTTYAKDGRAYVNRQNQVIDIHGGRITAEASTPGGRWRATYTRGGRFSLTGAEALDGIGAGELREALGLVLHRVCGPFNLLANVDRPGAVARVWFEGRNLTRVAVSGGEARPVAYYFDDHSGLLHMMTCGSEKPGRDGTVTLYTYKMLPNGAVFPGKIRIVKTGRHVLIGRQMVMEVEFGDVQID